MKTIAQNKGSLKFNKPKIKFEWKRKSKYVMRRKHFRRLKYLQDKPTHAPKKLLNLRCWPTPKM